LFYPTKGGRKCLAPLFFFLPLADIKLFLRGSPLIFPFIKLDKKLGRFLLTKSDTRCPLIPCPSKTPKIQRPLIPAKSL
jgi:hypothetical protein